MIPDTSLSRQGKLFLLGCLAVFAALNLTGLHGYSISAWHSYIDHSAAPEILFGSARTARNDDFALDLPLAFAGMAHDPKFPFVNDKIGLGQPVTIPYKIPLGDMIDVFRPSVWGFYVSPDVGMSWAWWTMSIGLLASAFLALWILTERDFLLSLSGAIFFSGSSFFSLWSFHTDEIVIFGFLIFVALAKILTEKSMRLQITWGVFLGWSLVGFLTSYFYPPRMIVVFLSIAALTLAYLVANRRSFRALHRNGALTGLAIAAVICAIGAARFYSISNEAIVLIRETAYPGRRTSNGGEIAFWKYFVENFLVQYTAARLKWGPLKGASEASSFSFFTPLVLLAAFPLAIKRRRMDARLVLPSLIALLLLAYGAFGLPSWLSSVTLLSLTVAKRVVLGIGLCSLFGITSFLKLYGNTRLESARWLWLAYGAFSLVVVALIKRGYPELPFPMLAIGFTAHMALTALVLSPKRRFTFVAAAIMTIPLSLSYNPLVRGGFQYVQTNALSRKITELSGKTSSAQWLVVAQTDNDIERALVLSSLPRILNVPSIGGASCPPELHVIESIRADWRTSLLNQCGHLVFELKSAPGETLTKSEIPGQITQEIRLSDPFIAKLKVGFVISVGAAIEPPVGWQALYQNDNVTVLRPSLTTGGPSL